MKYPRIIQHTVALGCLIYCASAAAAADDSPEFAHAEWVTGDDPVAAEIRSIGEAATKRVADSLLEDASSSVATYSLADAVSYCHLKWLPDAGPLLPDQPRVTAIKLTGPTLRNPANAPDAAEKLALERIRALVAAGMAPTGLLVQRVRRGDGTEEWRVYRSLVHQRRCDGCHGTSQSESLRIVLHDRYPDDAAVGYKIGQWRGLVRVTVASTAASAVDASGKR